MPTLKVEILGMQIEINYVENERKKLLHLINSFKKRLSEFSNNNGRISNNKIIFLAALKAEDQLEETRNLIDKNEENNNRIFEQKKVIDKLSKEIIVLKDKVQALNDASLLEENTDANVLEEIIILEKILKKIQQKILLKNDDRY